MLHISNVAPQTPFHTNLDYIEEAAYSFDIDPLLLRALVLVESNGNPKAISRKGAMGLTQLMPGTAKDLGIENPFDPRENVLGGARYLKEMLNRFRGDLILALAAYNAGRNAIERHKGLPDYPETISFVKRVLETWRELIKKKGPQSHEALF
ncbi:Membrane-bound lytic murein transglycosylase D precursor [Dissulfuribacter thermophilus]|uniref:Membrane-bound lytic murein transglycosylase D n=1 Tax=Dissulfuribacter thermophilus TaxID=1156395 RepID=A0A1B9F6Y9_9BACT|nr:Membrane-bound lytic murein transglycosylase D precursor [Dissulfuribacter thermophilus]